MSTMTDQFNLDVQGVEPELPVVFLWMGKSITASRNATADNQALADAGIIQLYDVEILVRTAVFTGIPAPVKNDDIQIQDAKTKAYTTYRIDKILNSQDGVCMTLLCVQRN